MTTHVRIKADGSHGVIEEDADGKPVIDATGANVIEDDGDTAWFMWDDIVIVPEPTTPTE